MNWVGGGVGWMPEMMGGNENGWMQGLPFVLRTPYMKLQCFEFYEMK